MVSLSVAFLLCAAGAPNDAVLLEFTAPWCEPCRSMEPVIAQLTATGYPVQKVNVDRDRALAKKFRVMNIPCFVLVQGGEEIDRIVGPTSAGQLQGMFAKAGPRMSGGNAAGPGSDARDLAIERPLQRIAPNSPGHQRLAGSMGATAAQVMPVTNAGIDRGNPFRQASTNDADLGAGRAQGSDLMAYNVRLRIEDRDGFSHGSGTLIDTRGDQALVLTCGHIFRDSQGKGTITVDLFGAGMPKKLPGRLVSYDLDRDTALVSIRPGVRVEVAHVAPEGFQMRPGDRLYTVGCNNGGESSVEETRVLAINKFTGPANVQVAGQPVQGRSGGGLFTADGMIVGVCNAADPTDNAGLFAAAAAIHKELDTARLSSIYRRGSLRDDVVAVAGSSSVVRAQDEGLHTISPRAADLRNLAHGGGGVKSPMNSPGVPATVGDPATTALVEDQVTLADLRNQTGSAEVICIIHPRGNPDARSEVVVIDRASAEFLERLAAEKQGQQSRRFTSLEIPRGKSTTVTR